MPISEKEKRFEREKETERREGKRNGEGVRHIEGVWRKILLVTKKWLSGQPMTAVGGGRSDCQDPNTQPRLQCFYLMSIQLIKSQTWPPILPHSRFYPRCF